MAGLVCLLVRVPQSLAFSSIFRSASPKENTVHGICNASGELSLPIDSPMRITCAGSAIACIQQYFPLGIAEGKYGTRNLQRKWGAIAPDRLPHAYYLCGFRTSSRSCRSCCCSRPSCCCRSHCRRTARTE